MKLKFLPLLLAGAACAFSAHAHVALLHFEDVLYAREWRQTYETWGIDREIYSQGYVLRYAPAANEPYPTGFHAMGPLWRFNHRNTIAINANSCSASVTLTAGDNNPFNLLSMDLQELNGVESVPVKVSFTGVTADQETVRHSVVLNKSAAWQTVIFPRTFRRLQNVVWEQGDCITNFPHMFDNILLVPSHLDR
jgi:hypothetical protein